MEELEKKKGQQEGKVGISVIKNFTFMIAFKISF
jgi:hypothetical protein